MAASTSVRFDPLCKDNYDTWTIQMEAFLTKNDTWGFISGEKVKPEITEGNAATVEAARIWEKEDKKAKSDIILAIKPSELKQIKGCNTSREVWLKLKSIYQSSGPARKATLLKKLTLQKMADNGDVHEHLRRFFDTIDKLSEMEVEINEDLLTVMLLYSLPANFENFRCAIESRDELPSPEALRVKIIEEYDARKNGTDNVQNAMFAKKRFPNQRNTTKKGDSDKKSESVPKSEPFKYRCHRCRKLGHKAADCGATFKNKGDANTAKDYCLLISVEETHSVEVNQASDSSDSKSWCLDSGCSTHMGNGNAKFVSKLQPCVGNVKLASEQSSVPIEGKGSVSISADIDGQVKNVNVREVLRVPELRTNLLSVGKITDQNCVVIFDKKKAEIINEEGDIVLTADRRKGLYYVREVNEESNSNVEFNDHEPGSFEEWHMKMGHLNIRDLVSCDRKGAVEGMNLGSVQDDLICEICLSEKMTKTPFPKSSTRTSKLLEIVHSDVCGPMSIRSIGGARYVATFIDDYSRWCEIHVLKRKNEVFSAFKSFKAAAENKHGCKIQLLQTDNGTEYITNEFDEFLREKGIRRRLTITYTPEQNGIAERRNRTLVDMTRCLLKQSSLPLTFWAEAISTANYIRNRCPSKSLEGLTAFEKWNGKVPDVSHFRIFGSEVFTLNRLPTKGKFESRSKKGIFIGYSEESKGYRIWIPDERRVDVSRDVKFTGIPKKVLNNHEHKDENNDKNETQVELILSEGNKENHNMNDLNELRNDQDEINDQNNAQEDQVEAEPDQENLEDNQENQNDQGNANQQRRGRGRPRKIMTGLRGRPKLDYHTTNVADEVEEVVSQAEVPLEQAVRGPHADEWNQAIAAEVKSIIRNNTWIIVDRPKGENKIIGSRVVLRNKYKEDGTLERRKARIVARGFAQRPGIDFDETFAPVARLSSIRIMVALAVEHDMTIQQFDVTTAYLNGELQEKVFMEVPKYTMEALEDIIELEGTNTDVGRKASRMINELQKGNKVCLLKKALYGLRQAGRCWNSKIDEVLIKFGARKSTADPCIYFKGEGENIILISIYVDDILAASRSKERIAELGQYLSRMFEIKDLGTVNHCLGIEFDLNKNGIKMSQTGYIRDILERFGMSDSKPVSTPLDPGVKLQKSKSEPSSEESSFPYRELVGALMYLAVCTRPDISYTASYLSQFNSCYDLTHWTAAKRVLRYLQGSRDVGLYFHKSNKSLKAFVDADWANCPDDRRSYTGFAFILGNCPISWESKKQRTVALSSTEAEYMALSEAAKEASYLMNFFKELGFSTREKVTIFCDNNGARKLAENPIFHNRSKHIDVRHHYVRDILKKGEMEIKYIPTEEMAADVFTKGLPKPKLVQCLSGLGVVKIKS